MSEIEFALSALRKALTNQSLKLVVTIGSEAGLAVLSNSNDALVGWVYLPEIVYKEHVEQNIDE